MTKSAGLQSTGLRTSCSDDRAMWCWNSYSLLSELADLVAQTPNRNAEHKGCLRPVSFKITERLEDQCTLNIRKRVTDKALSNRLV